MTKSNDRIDTLSYREGINKKGDWRAEPQNFNLQDKTPLEKEVERLERLKKPLDDKTRAKLISQIENELDKTDQVMREIQTKIEGKHDEHKASFFLSRGKKTKGFKQRGCSPSKGNPPSKEVKIEELPAFKSLEKTPLELEIDRLERSKTSFFSFLYKSPDKKIRAYKELQTRLKGKSSSDVVSDKWLNSSIDGENVADVIGEKRFCLGLFAPKSRSFVKEKLLSSVRLT